MQTIIPSHPELARYIAAYDEISEFPFAHHLDEVNVVATSTEAFYLLNAGPYHCVARETILTEEEGEPAQGHFLQLSDRREVYFVPSEVAAELIPHLRPDGGSSSCFGTVEFWAI